MTETTPTPSKRPANGRNLASADLAPRPTPALAAAVAVAVAALLGVVGSIGLFVQRKWIISTSFSSLTKSNAKLKAKDRKTSAELMKTARDQVDKTHKGALIGALILLLALGFIGYGIYRGRYWARWGTIGIWVLCSFTNTLVGVTVLFSIGANIPNIVKVPASLGALSLIVAVVLVNLPTAAKWFALSKPVAPAGGTPRRGLFGPRPASGGNATNRGAGANRVTLDKTPTTANSSGPDRSRSKKRASEAQAVAKGADLARTRAKAASKSRRTEV